MIRLRQICFNHMVHFLIAVLSECVKRPGAAELLLAWHNLPRKTFYPQTHGTLTACRPLHCDREYVTGIKKKKNQIQKSNLFVLCSLWSLMVTCIVWCAAHHRSHVAFRGRLNFKEMEVPNPQKRRMDIEESVHAANPFVNGNQGHKAGWSI